MIRLRVTEKLQFYLFDNLTGRYLFAAILGQFWGYKETKKGWSDVDPNELAITFLGFYLRATFRKKIDQEMRQ